MYFHRIRHAASNFFRNWKATARRQQRTRQLLLESEEHRIVMADITGLNTEPPPVVEALYAYDAPAIESSVEGSSQAGDLNFESDQLQVESLDSGDPVIDTVRAIGDALSLIVAPNQFPFDSQPERIVSFAAEGALIPGVKGEPDGPNTLPSVLDEAFGGREQWVSIVAEAIESWDLVSGIDLVYLPTDDGAPLYYSPSIPGVRADIRIAGHFIDGPGRIVAIGAFPPHSDIVVDMSEEALRAGDPNILKAILVHEIAHTMGLHRSFPNDGTKALEAYLNPILVPQFEDIRRIQSFYGDDHEPNNSVSRPKDLGLLSVGVMPVANVSVHNAADVDLYKFAIGAPYSLSLVLQPVGQPYLLGDSPEAVREFDPRNQNDLRLEVLDQVGVVIATSAANPAGIAESITDLMLPAGQYFVRISGSTDDTQMYQLEIGVATAQAPLADFVVNTTEDFPDANPGDGRAEGTSGRTSIRSAVQEANAFPGHQSIFAPEGVYVLTIAGTNENNGTLGDLDITDAVTFFGAGAELTTLDAANLDRVIDVFADANISNIGLTHGRATGIYQEGAYNWLHDGGAGMRINVGASLVTFDDVRFVDNLTDAVGGAIFVNGGKVEVRGSSFEGNSARYGGAIENVGAELVIVDGTVFRRNSAFQGGGIGNAGKLVINDAIFEENRGGETGWGGGGGIFNFDTGATQLYISGTMFLNNDGRAGSAISSSADTLTIIEDSTFFGNVSTFDPWSQEYFFYGPVEILQSTNSNESTILNNNPMLNDISAPPPVLVGAGEQSIWLTGIDDGDPGHVQPLFVRATSDNLTLVSEVDVRYEPDDSTAQLVFAPNPGQSGTANITVEVIGLGPDGVLDTADDAKTNRTVSFVVTNGFVVDAKSGFGGTVMMRSNAMGERTRWLHAGDTLGIPFFVDQTGTLSRIDVHYSNDNFGETETGEIRIDGVTVGSVIFADTGDQGWGYDWNIFSYVGLHTNRELVEGWHQLEIVISGGDGYGVEVSAVSGQPKVVPVPTVTVQDAEATEAVAGGSELVFTLELSPPSALPVTVRAFTANETATAGLDYEPIDVLVVFEPGESHKEVRVPVLVDNNNDEGEETLSLILEPVSNAHLDRLTAEGRILDGPPVFSTLPPPMPTPTVPLPPSCVIFICLPLPPPTTPVPTNPVPTNPVPTVPVPAIPAPTVPAPAVPAATNPAPTVPMVPAPTTPTPTISVPVVPTPATSDVPATQQPAAEPPPMPEPPLIDAVLIVDSLLAPVRDLRDVNVDGEVTPIDALLIINYLNESNERRAVTFAAHFDTNVDGLVTPIDVLLVVNRLNEVAEGESAIAHCVPAPARPVDLSSPVRMISQQLAPRECDFSEPIETTNDDLDDATLTDIAVDVAQSSPESESLESATRV